MVAGSLAFKEICGCSGAGYKMEICIFKQKMIILCRRQDFISDEFSLRQNM